MYELDPSGDGPLTLRGNLPPGRQPGRYGNPVGADVDGHMYRPGKILQVGGGWWGNGGGPEGARAGFTVDITGGTATPVIEATDPMKYQRHWGTSTVLPTATCSSPAAVGQQRQRRLCDQPGDLGPRDR